MRKNGTKSVRKTLQTQTPQIHTKTRLTNKANQRGKPKRTTTINAHEQQQTNLAKHIKSPHQEHQHKHPKIIQKPQIRQKEKPKLQRTHTPHNAQRLLQRLHTNPTTSKLKNETQTNKTKRNIRQKTKKTKAPQK